MGFGAWLFGYNGVVATIGLVIVFTLVQRRRYILKLFPGAPVIRTALPLLAGGGLACLATAALARAFGGLPGPGGLGLRLVCFLGVYTLAAFIAERAFIADSLALIRQHRLPV